MVNANITWNAVANATGYRISIGTTSGGTQFLNNFNNGNSTTYNPTSDYAQNTIYYVTITPYNATGNALGCSEIQFITQIIPVVPSCATNISPSSGSLNVLVDVNITWNAVGTATGYRISIGTTSGGTDIVNNFDNGNSLTYNPAIDFNQNTTYYVTITPYNATGNAIGCSEIQFTTQIIAVVPSCATNISPSSGSLNVLVDANITWNAVATATGYRISIGTTSSGTDIVNNFDNGNSLTYNPAIDFNQNTTYYVTITPYNATGNAIGCSEIQFTTQIIAVVPSCATNISPSSGSLNVLVDANITWNAVATATGYRISIGTTSSGTNIVNNFDNGNVLTYNPITDFAQNTTYFVTITPYNTTGNAVGCTESQFKTTTTISPATSVQTLSIPSFFTPNNDNVNDIWQIDDPNNEIKTVYIFDRFGKLIKNIASNGNWNGNFNNQPLSSSDYWYTIELKSGEILKGHFTLKR